MILLIVSLSLMIISVFYSYLFYQKRLMFEFGFSFSGNYFLIPPVLFLLFNEVLPAPIDFIGTSIPNINLVEYQFELLMVLISWVTVNQFNFILSRFKFKNSWSKLRNINDSILFRLFFAYEFLAFFVFIASGLDSGGSHWAKSKEEFMKDSGSLGLLLAFLTAGARYSFVALSFYKLLEGKDRLFASVLMMICGITDLYTTGNRITVLLIVFCFFMYFLMKKKYLFIMCLGLLAVPFGWAMTIYRFIRSQIHSESSMISGLTKGLDVAEQMLQLSTSAFFEFVSGVTESVNVNVLMGIYKVFGTQEDFLLGSTYAKAIVWWIPRSIYEDKPVTITLEAAKIFAPYSNVSLVTTALGESFANFGFFSVLFLPLILLMVRLLIDKLCVTSGYAECVKLVYGFLLFRMAFSDLFVYMLTGLVFFAFLFFKYRIRPA